MRKSRYTVCVDGANVGEHLLYIRTGKLKTCPFGVAHDDHVEALLHYVRAQCACAAQRRKDPFRRGNGSIHGEFHNAGGQKHYFRL